MPSTWIELEVKCRDPRWETIMKENDPHVTLGYLGKDVSDKDAWRTASVVDRWMGRMAELSALNDSFRATSYDCFAFNTTVVKLKPSGILTKENQGILVEMLKDVYIDVSSVYEFNPHVTVGHGPYVIKEQVAGMEFIGTKVRVMHNSQELQSWPL
jgi:hypothetical protein